MRKAASLAIDRKGLSEAETLGASKPTGNVVLKSMEYALPIEPDPYDPAQAKKLLAEAGYPNGFDGGDLTPIPPYFAAGEAAVNYLGAVGIRMKLRTMERAAFFSAFQGKKLKGVCFCTIAIYGNASTRMAENVPSSGTYAYGGWPDVDELYQKQLTETDPEKRERDAAPRSRRSCTSACASRRSTIISGPSGIGPRVEDAGADEDRSVPLGGAARRGQTEATRDRPAGGLRNAPIATERGERSEMSDTGAKNTRGKPVAVVIGATSKWQAEGRNTLLAHGKPVDDSELPVGVRWGVGGAIAQKFAKEGFFTV